MIVREETQDRSYYGERAREERKLAAQCAGQAAALAHLKLASAYDKRAGRLSAEA